MGGESWVHDPFYERDVLCAIQGLASQLTGTPHPPSVRPVIGFKERRYNNMDTLAFFNKLFPCARYIVVLGGNLTEQTGMVVNGEDSDFDEIKYNLEYETHMLERWQQRDPDRRF